MKPQRIPTGEVAEMASDYVTVFLMALDLATGKQILEKDGKLYVRNVPANVEPLFELINNSYRMSNMFKLFLGGLGTAGKKNIQPVVDELNQRLTG